MKYPIVHIKTNDNTLLFGLFLEAPSSKTIFIHTHGTASNFYEEYFTESFAEKFIENNISLLSVNNRGAGVYDAYEKTGAATELFEDCVYDLDAWVAFAIERGYENIILSGHSLGTEKVVYYMGHGQLANKVSKIVLLAPADSYGSHRLHEGHTNTRKEEIENLLATAKALAEASRGEEFLPRYTYGSHSGILPKTANSMLNFLGEKSEIVHALPFSSGKLEAFSKITIPILAAIGDLSEFTGTTTDDALELMKSENPRTVTHKFQNCNHDFEGSEKELAEIVLKFIQE